MKADFPNLLKPLRVGPKTVRNRVLVTGHVPRLAENNLPSDRYIAYHRARARGGAGLQITGAQGVHPTGTLGTAYSLQNLDDRIIPGYGRLAEAVHEEGGMILAQLAHSAATVKVSDIGRPLWAPSPVQSELARETPHEMTVEEIAEMTAAFAAATGRAREGGLDGVELLSAFGFLIAAFLSPLSNRRTDAYGGTLQNRMRFALEIIDATRQSLGPDLILGMRIPGDERAPGGLDQNDMIEISRVLAGTGKIDYLNVIVGTNYNRLERMLHWGPTPMPHGVYVPLATAIKNAVNIPVFTAGRITDPRLAEAIVRDGKADMVAMTRAHIADPEIVHKMTNGREAEIRPCVGANVCITLTGGPLRCFHNPTAAGGTEDIALPLARTPRRVAVIGGGPAGMEAALTAAVRGHAVTLYEAGDRLGGRLDLWASGPLTKELRKAVDWRKSQLALHQVRVELDTDLKPDVVPALDCDTIILATGSNPAVSDLPEQIARNGMRVVTPEHVLQNQDIDFRHAIVRDEGGGREGLTAAEVLATKGREVTVVTSDFVVGEDVDAVVRTTIHQHLLRNGVTFRTGEYITSSDGQTVNLRNQFSDKVSQIDGVDLIVDWQGRVARDTLRQAAQQSGIETIIIGDALAPRTVTMAVAEGAKAGREV